MATMSPSSHRGPPKTRPPARPPTADIRQSSRTARRTPNRLGKTIAGNVNTQIPNTRLSPDIGVAPLARLVSPHAEGSLSSSLLSRTPSCWAMPKTCRTTPAHPPPSLVGSGFLLAFGLRVAVPDHYAVSVFGCSEPFACSQAPISVKRIGRDPSRLWGLGALHIAMGEAQILANADDQNDDLLTYDSPRAAVPST